MLQPLISVLTAMQLLLSGVSIPQLTLTTWFKTGEMLRFHVVAQDDTDEMQRIKLCVRDAVQACYRVHAPQDGRTMQDNARALLPELTEAAVNAARAEGFSGDVRVELDTFYFDARLLSSITLPAGHYPALMIFLGDAQGRNWWGLLDPELSIRFALVPGGTPNDGVCWDWSLEALWAALFHQPLITAEEA